MYTVLPGALAPLKAFRPPQVQSVWAVTASGCPLLTTRAVPTHEAGNPGTPDRWTPAAREAGRDPDAISKGLFIFTCVADSRAEAHATAEARLGRLYGQDFSMIVERCCAVGTPEECVARIRDYVEAGARHIILVPCCPAKDVPAQVQTFATRLAPHIRQLVGKDG